MFVICIPWFHTTFNSNILFSIAEEDYDAFCLAYMFTYRDFEMGTLGLAWTGDLKNAGGVCEKNGVSRIKVLLNNALVYIYIAIRYNCIVLTAANLTPKSNYTTNDKIANCIHFT